MAPLNSPKEKLSANKIRTLTNAARISHNVKGGATLGPNSNPLTADDAEATDNRSSAVPPSSSSSVPPKAASPSASTDPPKPRWTMDAWRSVDAAAERSHTATDLTLTDCRAVRFTMSLRTAEKAQRQIVRQKQSERTAAYDELLVRLEQFKIDSTERALHAVRQATLEKERQYAAAARQFDEEARVAAERRRLANEEHRRRCEERAARMQRDEEIRGHFEAIKSAKSLFIVVFERLVKTILQNQQQLPGFAGYSGQQEAFLQRYEQLLGVVNQGQITALEVRQLEELCDEMRALQKRIDEEVTESGERLQQLMAQQATAEAQRQQHEADAEAALQQQQQQQALEAERQQQQVRTLPQQLQQTAAASTVDSVDTAAVTLAAVPLPASTTELSQFVHADRLAVYTHVIDFYEQYKLSVKPLQADDSLRTYRFNCQKAVNIPLNAISAVSAPHLIDKFDKLCSLLSGAVVQVADTSVSAAQHPLGVRFCALLAAKKLVKQADSIISVDPKHAFPIAAMIVAVWQRYPDIGQLCMAHLYKESPYLAPYFLPHRAGQSSADFLQSLGYRFADGQVEDPEMYLKRQTGLVRLYAAIVVSQPRRSQTGVEHPHGLANGWLWLAHFVNLDPLPDICTTLVHEFLVVAGADLWRTYGQQFHKLVAALYQQYLVKLKKVDKGGPRERLEALLVGMLENRRIEEPTGKLPANFW